MYANWGEYPNALGYNLSDYTIPRQSSSSMQIRENGDPSNCSKPQFSTRSDMTEEIAGASGEDTLHGHGIENASGFTQSVANQEHRLIARLAKTDSWVIPKRSRLSAPEVMQCVVEDENAEPRERIQAARTLVMMGNANMGQASVDVRINQQIAIVEAPTVPENVNIDVQPAWVEIVNPDNMHDTVAELQASGLMSMYLDQVKNKPQPLPSNGNGGLN